jgi:hypothetical protein
MKCLSQMGRNDSSKLKHSVKHGMFMAARLSKRAKSLATEVDFSSWNVPSHASLSLKQFLASKQVPVL